MADGNSSLSSRIGQLLLISIVVCAVAHARSMLGPLQETVQHDLKLTDNQIAWLQGPALAVPMILCSIGLGVLVDRHSRVRLFGLAMALTVLASVLTAFASTFVALLTVRGLVGLAVATILVGAYSMVADLYPPAQRGRATMVAALGEVGGAPVAFALGGILLGATGVAWSAASGLALEPWRFAVLVMTAPLVLVLVLMTGMREPQRTDVAVENAPLRDVWPRLWAYRAIVVPLLIARIMVWIADGAVFVWAAPSFARKLGLPPERIGAIMGGALLVSGVVGPICGGALADICQRRGGPRLTLTTLGALALLSAPAGLFSIVPHATLAGVSLAAFLTIGFTIGTIALTFGMVVLPGDLRGLYLGISLTVAALFSMGVAPLVVSTLSGALGGPMMIGKALAIVCAGTSVLGAVVFILASRHFASRPGNG